MRKVAFAAVVMSTVAVVAAVVSLPLVYSYVQSLQTHLQERSEECRVSCCMPTGHANVVYVQMRARDMYHEMEAITVVSAPHRQRRSWLFGQWVSSNYGGEFSLRLLSLQMCFLLIGQGNNGGNGGNNGGGGGNGGYPGGGTGTFGGRDAPITGIPPPTIGASMLFACVFHTNNTFQADPTTR